MDVESDHWEAAALARDNAAITLLHALTLDAQPVRALYLMMRLFAYLGEPAWMDNLFRHQAGEVTGNSDDISPAGHQRFATYGGSLLIPPPRNYLPYCKLVILMKRDIRNGSCANSTLLSKLP